MATAKIIYVNHWRDGSLYSTSSENPQFRAQSTQDDNVSEIVWRSIAGALSPNIIMDFGSAKTYDFIAVQGHNFTSGATIKIYGADNAAITTNVVTDTLPYNGNNIYVRIGTARTKRYVKFYVSDASNPSNYIQVANIVIGQLVDIGFLPFPDTPRGPVDSSEMMVSPSGADFPVVIMPPRWIWQYRFDGLSDTAAAYINALNQYCGVVYAWLLCLDDGTPNDNSYWLKSTATNRPVKHSRNNHSWDSGDLIKVS